MFVSVMDLDSDVRSSWLELENEVNDILRVAREEGIKVKSLQLISVGDRYRLMLVSKKPYKTMLGLG